MTKALYGPDGFFTGPQSDGPIGHFRTSAHSQVFAGAVARLLTRLDMALDRPASLDVVDVGAGRGELLAGLLAAVPGELASRLRPHAVDLAPRPTGLPEVIGWSSQPAQRLTGLLIATEWLDNVPIDVAELDPAADNPGGDDPGGYDPGGVDPGGDDPEVNQPGDSSASAGAWSRTIPPRYVLVDREGRQRPGPPVEPADGEWLARWWPLTEPGSRAEIGAPRDVAWADAVARVERGLALTVDYAHHRDTRPPFGTLTGYRRGRAVEPVPDGSCDLTAHVALDAVAAAGERVAGIPPVLLTQRAALRALGVDGGRPPLSLATTDPAGYVRRLAAAGEAAELIAGDGLGAHEWLFQPVGGHLDVAALLAVPTV